MKISSFSIGLMLGGMIISCNPKTETTSLPNSPTSSIESFIDVNLTTSERDSLIENLSDMQADLIDLHKHVLSNSTPPALQFNPIPVGFDLNESVQIPVNFGLKKTVKMPENKEELAFFTVADLSVLIKNKQISSTELTQIYLERLKKHGPELECVITITEETALAQAKRADDEIAAGKYRGPLHGIPYGVKDLLAVEGYKTTWGAAPFKNQTIDMNATVVKQLEEAGAVLIAKLTMGALAMGDVWYGGVTKNPWNKEQGSSGSSAGSASATSAGLVAFSIGTETLGSIVSPSTRCGTTGLRPSYGRVSRTGAMALCWSMDKIGPICRSALDCAIVFNSIIGQDQQDQSLYNQPFNFDATSDIHQLKIGYLADFFDSTASENDKKTIETLRAMNLKLEEVKLPDDLPIGALIIILQAEAAAAFDEITRNGEDDLLVRQDKYAWPNSFRSARFIPAVDYINANRVRFELIQEMHALLKDFDVIVTPSFAGRQLLITNLTGQPCVVVPNGFNSKNSPTSISFIGNMFEEGKLLQLAAAYQQATDFDEQHPNIW